MHDTRSIGKEFKSRDVLLKDKRSCNNSKKKGLE